MCPCQAPQETPEGKAFASPPALIKEGVVKGAYVVSRAKIPVLKCVDSRFGLPVDISFGGSNGVEAVALVKDWLAAFSDLAPLMLVLKFFFHQKRLNEVFTGGIGSYGLLSMAVAHLKLASEAELAPRGDAATSSEAMRQPMLGKLLYSLLKRYGVDFDYLNQAVAVSRGGVVDKAAIGAKRGDDQWAIEDPQQPGLDIGVNSFRFMEVRQAFQAAALSLLAAARTASLNAESPPVPPVDSPRGISEAGLFSALGPMLKGICEEPMHQRKWDDEQGDVRGKSKVRSALFKKAAQQKAGRIQKANKRKARNALMKKQLSRRQLSRSQKGK
ncbi:hypothetical protein CYMTET_50601 [Cymbomonas tetramitiformis]|uniref:PAP-associated domain-containing protein n=1 Tax=Cymbomonas tetramitiformis TaxID=36881 RepID=A0AAE0BMY3_9CHLO|nr:hypothetical protein CYMTET_50601 [Cymbomonas tetramitiformis]